MWCGSSAACSDSSDPGLILRKVCRDISGAGSLSKFSSSLHSWTGRGVGVMRETIALELEVRNLSGKKPVKYLLFFIHSEYLFVVAVVFVLLLTRDSWLN